MSEEQRRKLQQQLWNIANTLRGKMNADEFRDYILGFIFYKYLSEKITRYGDTVLAADGVKFIDLDEASEDGQAMIQAVRDAAVKDVGYFLKPSELFHTIAQAGINRQNSNSGGESYSFILGDLAKVLKNIEQSTLGQDSADEFSNLFEDLDLSSSKLGATEKAKNELVAKVLGHLDKIDFNLSETDGDVLGDAYEYLIGQFASGAGRKAGEFYTPQPVSTLLAKIVTLGKQKLRRVYDPTCGSGSLLLRVKREVQKVDKIYGQELNRTTYNLARMNMLLHDVHYADFDIKQEDTLEHPQHLGLQFDAIVANPPFSVHWSANPLFLSDDRFSQYGRLAPSTKADLAFVQHMIAHLSEDGCMAVVLPHGALFRAAAEGQIRRYLVEQMNYVDAVIGLPANIFYGTEIPTCVLVLKKCRKHPEDVLFIDASTLFDKSKTQNTMTPDYVRDIVNAYKSRESVEGFTCVASLEKIADNDFNLSIPRYVNTLEVDHHVDLKQVTANLAFFDSELKTAEQIIGKNCLELGIPPPIGGNIYWLIQYKKGVMQKIFNQDLRFKNGRKSFSEWKPMELHELAQKIKTKNRDNSITNVLTNSATLGVISQNDYFDRDIVNKNNLDGYYVVEPDDFVYNPRISANAPVGPIKRNKNITGVMSPLYTVFRFRSEHLDFIEQFFETNCWHDYMRSVSNSGARHDRMNIKNENFFALPLLIPCEDEQKKIALFLCALDKKIASLRSGNQAP
jgi:type I restriction enzyme M protein